MTLHPDILTDLVSLYHAGEASEASRALLEEEALRNPRLAAALAATSRPLVPLPVDPFLAERRVLRKVRVRYQAISFAVVWTLTLLLIVLAPFLFVHAGEGGAIAIAALPFLLLLLLFVGAAGALYFLVRAFR